MASHMKGLLQLPIYLYPVVKEILVRQKLGNEQNFLTILASIALSLTCYIPILIVFLLFWMYKAVINLCLRKKYGKSFVGIMEGIDSSCCNQDKCVPIMMAFVEFRGEVNQLRDAVVEQLKGAIKVKHHKIFYSRAKYMGYHFYYREDVAAEEYVEVMTSTGEDFLDKKGLSKNLEPYDAGLLPLGNRKMLQILICPQRIRLREHPNNNNIFCVAYRFHHCVGDARSLFHWFVAFLTDNKSKILQDKAIANISKSRPAISMSMIKNYLTNLRLKDFPIVTTDKNPLRGYNLCNKKHLVWYSDTKSECMDTIRRVKRNFKGTTFLDILNTCLASSLHDYYIKKGLDLPKKINAGIALSSEVVSMISYGEEEVELSNKFAVALIRLPIKVDADDQLKARVDAIRQEYKLVRTSFDLQLNNFIGKYFLNLIPAPITKWLESFVELTIGISSLPGLKKFTTYGGSPVVDCVVMIPNTSGTGLHVFFSTFDGQLRITLSVDKSIICSFKDSQNVVDGIIHYLQKLSDKYCKNDQG